MCVGWGCDLYRGLHTTPLPTFLNADDVGLEPIIQYDDGKEIIMSEVQRQSTTMQNFILNTENAP